MGIPDVLGRMGLNQKEAEVYVALLELGTASVYAISKKAAIKRPTTYLVLDSLQRRGLVSAVPRSKKALYTAENPEYLLVDIKKREELMKRYLPNLLAIFNLKKDKPQVQLFEGHSGLEQVYDKVFDSPSVDFFGTIKDLEKYYPEWLDHFSAVVREKNIKVRDLLSASEINSSYYKKVKDLKAYQMRFLPEGLIFLSDSALFQDNVVFFSFRPEVFAIMVTSKDISQSVRTLFDLAWRSAEKAK